MVGIHRDPKDLAGRQCSGAIQGVSEQLELGIQNRGIRHAQLPVEAGSGPGGEGAGQRSGVEAPATGKILERETQGVDRIGAVISQREAAAQAAAFGDRAVVEAAVDKTKTRNAEAVFRCNVLVEIRRPAGGDAVLTGLFDGGPEGSAEAAIRRRSAAEGDHPVAGGVGERDGERLVGDGGAIANPLQQSAQLHVFTRREAITVAAQRGLIDSIDVHQRRGGDDDVVDLSEALVDGAAVVEGGDQVIITRQFWQLHLQGRGAAVTGGQGTTIAHTTAIGEDEGTEADVIAVGKDRIGREEIAVDPLRTRRNGMAG